ncbi:MAG: flagellar biosynthesis regulator FlaF [Alphaproteobacteria bacterium]
MSYNNDPYGKATKAYDTNAQAHTTSQRELEARILLKSNRMMQSLIDNWDNRPKDSLADALTYNRQIWVLFYDTALENKDEGRPNDLRSNIVNLANFIFKREIDILAEPKKEKLNILMSINREISAGLMVPQPGEEKTAQQTNVATEQNHAGSTTDISG